MASRICCMVQAAVGCVVTLQCRIRRVPISITTSTYSTWKRTETATKKSQAKTDLAWFRMKVRQRWEPAARGPERNGSCGQ